MTLLANRTSILSSDKLDKAFIIYSFICGFLFLFVYVLLIDVIQLDYLLTNLILLLIFAIFFDAHHFFGTYYRIILDKLYFKKNKPWFIATFVLLITSAILSQWLMISDYPEYESYLFFQFFRRFVLILGFYHLIKQNWGFMALYKRMQGEKPTRINWNLLALISGSFIPLIYITIQQPIWFPGSEELLFNPAAEQYHFVIAYWHRLAKLSFVFSLLFALTGFFYRKRLFAKPFISLALYCAFVGLLIVTILAYDYKLVLYCLLIVCTLLFLVSLLFSIYLQRQEACFNHRKWLVFGCSLLLYCGAFLFPIEGSKYIVVAAITIPHNIQYIAFVPIFSKRQYSLSNYEHGVAEWLAERVIIFIVLGLFFAVFFELGRSGSQHFLPDSMLLTKNFIAVFFATMALHHYYLDAVIWKFSKNKSLKSSL